MNRFFVDDRCGCVAVRDRTLTDPEYQGLHEDTEGVVKFWMKQTKPNLCPTCGHYSEYWDACHEIVSESQELCDRLNRECVPSGEGS